jgi:hypothetical protein
MDSSCTGTELRPRTNNLAPLYSTLFALSGCLLIALISWTSFRNAASMTEAAASELNHHLAGYLLLIMSAMIVTSVVFAECRALRFVWPLLFIALGLFLAAWSDAEIWPRGPLSWSWLIHHDAEARQHKLYAVILIAIGLIELLRASGKLPSVWQRWALPLLAVCGAGLLTMHAHGGTSGLPQGWNSAQPMVLVASPAPISIGPHAAHHDHAQNTSNASDHVPREHTMTATMLKIQRQHFWMTIAGIVFAFSKFLADSRSSLSRFMQFVWPSAMACVGVLLVIYRE